jgi:amino acid transporter
MYNYGGYNNICNIGEEIRSPSGTVPRAIVLSIVIVVVLYVVMSTVILGMVPWREAQQTRTIASLFIARHLRRSAQRPDRGDGDDGADPVRHRLVALRGDLGYSRIPFAAARDGQFFAPSAACTRPSTFRTCRC